MVRAAGRKRKGSHGACLRTHEVDKKKKGKARQGKSRLSRAIRALLAPVSLFFFFLLGTLSRIFASRPKTSGTLELKGLSDEVEVIYDRAGIPHVYATTDEDGLRALGYVVAQDRLFQMDIMRRTATGRLSELISVQGLEIDRFMRTIGLHKLGRKFLDNVDEKARRLVDAYVDGINQFISRPRWMMPVEYMILGKKPEKWKLEDAFSVGIFLAWMLDAGWPADLMREKLIRKLGIETAKELLPQSSEISTPICAFEGPGCKAETMEPLAVETDWELEEEGSGGTFVGRNFKPAGLIGSNNWVVSGAKTTTGMPILCNDPHIQHMVPSTLYLSHLKTPSFNVIGAGFVGIPIIGIGHNERCAWGVTSFMPDLIDLYVEEFESESSKRYLYRGEWLEARERVELIKVRFLGTRKMLVLETIHGPVIKRKGNKGLALKWTGMDTSFDLLGPFLKMNEARNWTEFREALRDYLGPAFNFVYADLERNIGYQGAAKVPVRALGDGSIPVSGKDGKAEWVGYIPFDEMPYAFNPESGWLATANHKVVSDSYPHLLTTCWDAPDRQSRIAELLCAKERLSVEDMKEIQGDVFTRTGRTFSRWAVEALRGLEVPAPVTEAVRRLEKWDSMARKESVEMTIYYFSFRHLARKLLEHRLGAELFAEYMKSWPNWRLAVENIVNSEDPFWLPPGCSDYRRLIIDSVEEGFKEIESLYGTRNQEEWQWGKVHTLTAFHPVGLFWPLNKIFNVGPVPRDGEAETVNNALPESDPVTQLLSRGSMGGSAKLPILPDENSHATYAGPVCRFIADLSDWDNSLMVLDIGQSGHILSHHYKDHFEKWIDLDYFKLEYTNVKPVSALKLLPG